MSKLYIHKLTIYLVFRAFDINELYNIIIENIDCIEVLRDLFKPMASDLELIE